MAADQTTEGSETLTVTVQGKTASTTIVDSSITSSISYTITAEQSSVVEGSTVTFVILKTGSLASSTVYFSTLAGTASTRDGDYLGFSDQVLYFGFGINSISVPVSTVADNLIEADETFYGVVYAIPGEQGDFLAGRFLAQSNAITIKDQAAIYTVSVNSSQVSEGSTD
nr:hypothetical protein [Oxalobacteraceae bacterium]